MVLGTLSFAVLAHACGSVANEGDGDTGSGIDGDLSPEEQRRLRRARRNKRVEIDQQIDSTIAYMLDAIPRTEDYIARSLGMLVIPTVTKVGFFVGGSGGEGGLRINGETVGYYSAAEASLGLQVGVGQYSHVLFFMTEAALHKFRTSRGWALGTEVGGAMLTESDFVGTSTITRRAEVIGLNFGGQGAIVGASARGMKYTRLEDY